MFCFGDRPGLSGFASNPAQKLVPAYVGWKHAGGLNQLLGLLSKSSPLKDHVKREKNNTNSESSLGGWGLFYLSEDGHYCAKGSN